MNMILIVSLVLIGLAVVWVIVLFNGLIKLKNRVEEAWSDIDVQLKRRYDLIPNLIETVKGFAKQEKEVLESVTEARTRAMGAQDTKDQVEAENMLSDTLKSLFAVSENYPDLKSNENFLELQRELSDTENKIQAARRFYNGNVRDFNTKIQTFPNNMIAGTLQFNEKEFFEAGEEEKKNIQVKF
jgi:LemA protein